MSTPEPSTEPAPPPRPRARGLLLGRPSTKGRWSPALRSGLALAAASGILLAFGFGQSSLLASLGVFAGLYGERRPYLLRWKVILTAGVLLVTSAVVFGALGSAIGSDATTPEMLGVVAAMAVLTAVSVFVGNALRLGPPGPYFFLLVAGVAQIVGQHGTTVAHLATFTAVGVAVSLAMSMAPALWRPHGPEFAATAAALGSAEQYLERNREAGAAGMHGVAAPTLNAWSVLHDAAATDGELAKRLWAAHQRVHGFQVSAFVAPLPRPSIKRRLRFAARPYAHATVSAARATVATALAGSIAVLAGLGRPDWAVLSAALVLQMGPDRMHGAVRGTHRVVGTLVGVGLYAALHMLDLHIGVLIVVLTLLNMLIELTVSTNYAFAVMFITPLALLIGGPNTPIAEQVRDRILETVLGVGIALIVAWVMLPRAHRRTLRDADSVTLRVGREVVTTGAEIPVDDPVMRAGRRDLQWHLLEAELAASDTAADDPSWAHDHWPAHTRVRDLGYDVLGACWRTTIGTPLDDDVARDLTHRLEEPSR